MKYGYYADNQLPQANNPDYKTNSHGYRCPEFSPIPDGGKNVVVLGCSHTFGEGLEQSEIWIQFLEELLDNKLLRFWNLGQPGASPDKCVRILYGSEKILFPKIIIVCWPVYSRRERLTNPPMNITGADNYVRQESEETDFNNFLKCVFQIEKFAEYNNAETFHCFAQEVYPVENLKNVFKDTSLAKCWPRWDHHRLPGAHRNINEKTSLARDGIHYGVEHHREFARLFYKQFGSKLR